MHTQISRSHVKGKNTIKIQPAKLRFLLSVSSKEIIWNYLVKWRYKDPSLLMLRKYDLFKELETKTKKYIIPTTQFVYIYLVAAVTVIAFTFDGFWKFSLT